MSYHPSHAALFSHLFIGDRDPRIIESLTGDICTKPNCSGLVNILNLAANFCILQVELRAWLGADYVQGSLCGKMPDLMRKDVEKLIAEYSGSKTLPERFTRREQAAREAAAEVADEAGGSQASSATGATFKSLSRG